MEKMTLAEQLLQELQEVKMKSSVLMFSGVSLEEMATIQRVERIAIIERYFDNVRRGCMKKYTVVCQNDTVESGGVNGD